MSKKAKIFFDYKDKVPQKLFYDYSPENQQTLTLVGEDDFELQSALNDKSRNIFNKERLSSDNSENNRLYKSIEDTKKTIDLDRTRLELRSKVLDSSNELKFTFSKFEERDSFKKSNGNTIKINKLSTILPISKISEIMDALDSLKNNSIEEVSAL